MVGHLPLSADLTTVPPPRRPPDATASGDDQVRRWYENELGWPTVPEDSSPDPCVRLRVGLRFDVLDIPAAAGHAALRHLTAGSPVAVRGDRMRLLVAAGSADELPGILDWLEWGRLPLDLHALGPGDSMEAPTPPEETSGEATGVMKAVRKGMPGPDGSDEGSAELSTASGPDRLAVTGLSGAALGAGVRPLVLGRPGVLQGAAVWLRPPEPGCEVEASLPTMSALGRVGSAPDLVRVVDTVATHCHRIRLRTRP
ncbi:SCO3374 family protein [Streptomyces sp. NPDC057253]|uniref:SCO3374 family protein n=1 Tax=Streptomyces sp. NPDC057253 TaxID=3346069 RepID=UPI00363827E1